MKILAFDTSSPVLTVALFDDDKKIAELESSSFARHSSVLVPSLQKMLKDHQVPLNEIDVLAIGLGPGSFTGLRVGITTAKILAYVCNMKIVGVSSLEAIALGVHGFQGEIAVILDAKKDKLYSGIFQFRDEELKVIQGPKLVNIQKLLKGVQTPRLFLGDGVENYREKILKTNRCRLAEGAEWATPKASDIAKRAAQLAKKKEWRDPFDLRPFYLHPRDCNVTKK